ncbi:MAG TPA: gamma-glutamyl-gamma-aminobutyrate hydrolase family protein [Thermodesulfobacteriota bacterium]|nr:gamma-glutamyl-gamma-aminobutyrate hydrolase family protein [Thermodesulfobacteriota bacterium]
MERVKKAVVIQHVPHEGLGAIGNALAAFGISAEFVRVYRGERVPAVLERGTLLIVLGGPMGVYESERYPFLKDELNLLERAFKKDSPVLGICLGSQLMAKAAGAKVYKGGKKEIGWYDVTLTGDGARDGIFLSFPEKFRVFQWHGDTFDVPQGARLLASSAGFPNQLIRIGKRAYGIQFHLEVTERMIYEWLKENSEELASLKGVIEPEEIKKRTPSEIMTLNNYGRTVFTRFLRA